MKFLILVLLIAFSSVSMASTMIEPFIGTTISGDFENNDCSSNCEDDVSGTFYGVRAAYKNLGFFGGVDVRLGTYKLDDADFEIDEEGRIALLIGYELPVMFKFWLTYALSNNLTAESSTDGSELEYSTSSDITLGVGYSPIPMLSLNLEYTMLNLDENEDSDGSTNDLDADINTILLSASVPFSF